MTVVTGVAGTMTVVTAVTTVDVTMIAVAVTQLGLEPYSGLTNYSLGWKLRPDLLMYCFPQTKSNI